MRDILPLPVMAPRAYFLEELPSAHDESIGAFLRTVEGLAPAEARQRRLTIADSQAWLLIAFATRMAGLAVRERNERRLKDALSALIFEAGILDMREILQCLALVYDAASRIDVDPRALFTRAAASQPGGNVSPLLLQFINRKPEDRSIEAMRFRTVGEGSSFKYERTW